MKNNIISKKLFTEELNLIQKKFSELSLKKNENFHKLCSQSYKSLKKGHKIIFFGNGGSAADAQHLATEITVRYKKNRPALAAISLSTDTSALTAIGNDFSFNEIFSRQIEAIAKKGDVILGITTSGNSKNVINAFKMAKKKKVESFCFTGNNGGKVKRYCKNCIIFPKTTTSVTQVMQIAVGQIFCEFLETRIFPN